MPIAHCHPFQIEEAVFLRIQELFRTPEMVTKVWRKAVSTDSSVRENQVVSALKMIHPIWEELFPIERNRILHLLIEAVILTTSDLEIQIRMDGVNSLVTELSDDKKERKTT